MLSDWFCVGVFWSCVLCMGVFSFVSKGVALYQVNFDTDIV